MSVTNYELAEQDYIAEKLCYVICTTDNLWKYSEEHNIYQHNTIKEALKVAWQS